jgi:uncharacterized protein YgbK (DUF1537 family)
MPTRPFRFGVLADDLTGSCDTGVQFAQRGFSTLVRLDPAHGDSVQVAILCTNSRNDQPDAARSKVRQACELLAREQRDVAYKKIDSTLQGNLWPELDEAMKSCHRSLAIVAPAFPALGRTMAEGWLRVAGSPAPHPVHLPSLLRRQGAPAVIHVGGTLPRSGPQELMECLEEISAGAGSVVAVVDAISQNDLALIVHAAAELRSNCLLAGSAGLASEAADFLAKKYSKQAPQVRFSRAPAGCVVLILGSTHPVTLEQIRYLVRSRPTAVVEYAGRSLGEVPSVLAKNGYLMVKLTRNDNEVAFGELARILGDQAIHGVILSGGDTADRVCRALKVTAIRLDREILPGIPLGYFEGGCADGMAVATKAGGFGEEDSLAIAADFLAAQGRPLR